MPLSRPLHSHEQPRIEFPGYGFFACTLKRATLSQWRGIFTQQDCRDSALLKVLIIDYRALRIGNGEPIIGPMNYSRIRNNLLSSGDNQTPMSAGSCFASTYCLRVTFAIFTFLVILVGCQSERSRDDSKTSGDPFKQNIRDTEPR